MSVRFSCEKCGSYIKTSDEKIGRKIICASCGQTNKVPESNDVVVETLGVRTRTGDAAGGKQGQPGTENLMQELVQTYRTRDIGRDRSDGYRFNLFASFNGFFLPVLLILLFIAGLFIAYTVSSGMMD